MYFQSIDDKEKCVGIYQDGKLIFDIDTSTPLIGAERTWKYSGSIVNEDVEYAWLVGSGRALGEMCPPSLQEDFERSAAKMRAFKKTFELAKINFAEHCFFDLVPHDFLVKFLHLKNEITKHVFETHEKPNNYSHLARAHQLLYKIKNQRVNLNTNNCRGIFTKSVYRASANRLMNGPRNIDYNLFGTVTGRLATHTNSFPILTMSKQLRQLQKPHNDWFMSLDYNGAELRTALNLSGQEQPPYDIHAWNMENVLPKGAVSDRETAKTIFFSWLYQAESTSIDEKMYQRSAIVDKYYDDEYVHTPLGRKIKVDKRKAFNYIIQSTTADLVIDRAIEIDEYLKEHKSFVSHLVHDEVVIDLAADERHLAPEIKEIFSNNKLDKYLVNVNAGSDYYNLEKLNV
ncbi:hypothetical protein CMI37_01180 [Candidatus Pacearchaeota archaeon]|nr:hypothetical protein [Candidatus Pacearchaeota archaeon]